MKGWESLGFKSYQNYLDSDMWKDKKDMIFLVKGKRCENCGSKKNLVIHHLHYETVGNESSKDVKILCIKCHNEVHNGGE